MAKFDLVRYHVLNSIRAAIAESNGYQEEADRLRSQANLRLVIMSEEELQELSRMLSFLPSRPQEAVYTEIKAAIEDHKNTVDQWLGAFGVTCHVPEAVD